MDFFGGNNGSDMMAYCVIGSGNSQPVYTQNKLDTAITGVSGTASSTKYDYNAARDGNLYKTNKVNKYSFTGLNNVNISELGLASTYSNATTYSLCTRALIKDSQGNPTTITVLNGEILEIYYKLWAVFDTTDKTGQINLLDGVGGSVAYNYVLSPMIVGHTYYKDVGYLLRSDYNKLVFSGDKAIFTGEPSGNFYSTQDNAILSSYVMGSYKRVFTATFGIYAANGNIRVYGFYNMGWWQIRFGSVANDSPITKTNTQNLSIPVEFSWGRYEGAL